MSQKQVIQKGDKIRCLGIGYPHWKDEIFTCDLVFPNGTIGIKKSVRVAARDFEVVSEIKQGGKQ